MKIVEIGTAMTLMMAPIVEADEATKITNAQVVAAVLGQIQPINEGDAVFCKSSNGETEFSFDHQGLAVQTQSQGPGELSTTDYLIDTNLDDQANDWVIIRSDQQNLTSQIRGLDELKAENLAAWQAVQENYQAKVQTLLLEMTGHIESGGGLTAFINSQCYSQTLVPIETASPATT